MCVKEECYFYQAFCKSMNRQTRNSTDTGSTAAPRADAPARGAIQNVLPGMLDKNGGALVIGAGGDGTLNRRTSSGSAAQVPGSPDTSGPAQIARQHVGTPPLVSSSAKPAWAPQSSGRLVNAGNFNIVEAPPAQWSPGRAGGVAEMISHSQQPSGIPAHGLMAHKSAHSVVDQFAQVKLGGAAQHDTSSLLAGLSGACASGAPEFYMFQQEQLTQLLQIQQQQAHQHQIQQQLSQKQQLLEHQILHPGWQQQQQQQQPIVHDEFQQSLAAANAAESLRAPASRGIPNSEGAQKAALVDFVRKDFDNVHESICNLLANLPADLQVSFTHQITRSLASSLREPVHDLSLRSSEAAKVVKSRIIATILDRLDQAPHCLRLAAAHRGMQAMFAGIRGESGGSDSGVETEFEQHFESAMGSAGKLMLGLMRDVYSMGALGLKLAYSEYGKAAKRRSEWGAWFSDVLGRVNSVCELPIQVNWAPLIFRLVHHMLLAKAFAPNIIFFYSLDVTPFQPIGEDTDAASRRRPCRDDGSISRYDLEQAVRKVAVYVTPGLAQCKSDVLQSIPTNFLSVNVDCTTLDILLQSKVLTYSPHTASKGDCDKAAEFKQ